MARNNDPNESTADNVAIRVPELPESVSDATVAAWNKQPGDPVRRDENLVEIETDKVVFEVPAPNDGVLADIYKKTGATVTAGDALASLTLGETEQVQPTEPDSEAPAATGTRPSVDEAETPSPSGPLSPAVRRLVDEHGLDPSHIPATGKGGRLTKADVLSYIEDESVREPAPAETGPPPEEPAGSPTTPSTEDESGVRRVPMSRLRQRIAERMVEAQQTAAILSTFNEINLGTLQALRRRHRDAFEKRHGVKLGLMSFFVKAAIEALKRHPIVNASVEGNEILYHDFYDIGIAVSSPRGLVVPVLRDADQLSFADIEHQIADFGQRAQDGSLTMDELTGGTFTLTNGGIFGSLLSTPILNPPQSGILGMHKIEDRPVAENGEVVIRPMMYVALSYDHRIIDGREAVQFLVSLKESLEDPTRLLLDL